MGRGIRGEIRDERERIKVVFATVFMYFFCMDRFLTSLRHSKENILWTYQQENIVS